MTVPGGVAAWHDVECGSYAADLPLWRELADERGGPVLDLGCGTGRVALDLAARGHSVVGLDSEPDLTAALAARARERSLPVEAVTADARSFELRRRFPLALAAMQVVQLLGGAPGRAAFLRTVRGHLAPRGLLAVALADPFPELPPEHALLPLPDQREERGWVLSSSPLAVRAEAGATVIDLVRQSVSPAGELSEELVTIRLDELSPELLEAEAAPAGLRALGHRGVAETYHYVGSTVVLLEAP
jgi:SAM-dependent methyltransferase